MALTAAVHVAAALEEVQMAVVAVATAAREAVNREEIQAEEVQMAASKAEVTAEVGAE